MTRSQTSLCLSTEFFSKEDSTLNEKNISLRSLEETAQDEPTFIETIQNKFAKEKDHFFPLLNEAFLSDGLVLSVSGQTKEPLELLYIWSKSEGREAAFTKNYLKLEKGASLSLKEIHQTEGDEKSEFFSNTSFDIYLEQGAHLRYKKLFEEATGHRQIASLRAFLSKDSVFKSFYAGLGGDLFRQDTLVKLSEEGAETTLNGLYLSSQKTNKRLLL